MDDLARWAVGAVLAIAIALLARRARALDRSGARAAMVLGTVAAGAGWDWAALLVTYFASSSLLSRIGRDERERRTAGRLEKTGARDAAQVGANGGAFGVAALAFAATAHPAWAMAGAAALAASAADTWATEIGTLARAAPRSILSGRLVPPGTSGGVTVQGVMGGIAGAAFVGGAVAVLGWDRGIVEATIGGGILGMILDSVAGASAQARRWCARCDGATEQRVHHCGSLTELRGGVDWLDNDGVNVICTVGGAVFALLLWST